VQALVVETVKKVVLSEQWWWTFNEATGESSQTFPPKDEQKPLLGLMLGVGMLEPLSVFLGLTLK